MKKNKSIKKNKSKKINLAELISLYYGFKKTEITEINQEDEKIARTINKDLSIPERNKNLFKLEEMLALLRTNREDKVLNEPQATFIYQEKEGEIHLHILNSSKSVSDVLILRSAQAILEEYGFKNTCVVINSIGCKQAWSQFIKETSTYFKRNLSSINPVCRQAIKKNILAPLLCNHKECLGLRENSPEPMNYLNEEDRLHFKEFLEFIESLKIPYEIKPFLFGDSGYSTNTIFEIHDENGGVLAAGTRYNSLSKKIGFKKEVPCVGVRIVCDKNKTVPASQLDKFKNPHFHFVQIGFEAKIQSLILIDEMRKSKIPVFQTLNRDRISVQLQSAKTSKAPYVILMGQKEALDGTVIIRDVETRAQKTIFIKEISDYLKKIIKNTKKK